MKAYFLATGILGVIGGAIILSSHSSRVMAFEGRQPISTAHFVDSLGVNTHINFTGPAFSSYENLDIVEKSLRYLGVSHVRDGNLNMSPAQVARYAHVAQATGVKFDFLIGSGGNLDMSAIQTDLHRFLDAAPGSLSAVEGSNEINNLFQSKNWVVKYKGQATDMCAHQFGAAVNAQRDLKALMKADARLKTIPLYNFSVVYLDIRNKVGGCHTDYQADIANIEAASKGRSATDLADYANLHDYPFQGAPPRKSFKALLRRQRVGAALPAVLTETGYSTGDDDSHRPYLAVSEAVQAKYLLSAVMDSYTLGIRRTFLYELLEDRNDTPATSLEPHYGLFHSDGRPKPAATALHNLIAILAPERGAAPVASEVVSYSLKASGMTFSQDIAEMQLLMRKTDGTNVLVLWTEPPLWDPGQRRERPPVKAKPVSLRLDQSYASVRVYDPLVSSKPIKTYARMSEVTINVPDHPVVVTFKLKR